MKNEKNEKQPKVKGEKKNTLFRLLRYLLHDYKGLLLLEVICIMLFSLVSVAPALYVESIVSLMENGIAIGKAHAYTAMADYEAIFASLLPSLLRLLTLMICVYLVGLLCSFTYNRLGAIITQGFLNKMRCRLFNHMQNLPIRYFDSHSRGDIMSVYTNDIDTLRQLISQSLPSFIASSLTILSLLFIMLYFSVLLSAVLFVGVIAMFFVTRYIGSHSAKYFMLQQKSMGKVEGYVEEMINGQKVVKVFCHEKEAIDGFDVLNDQLCSDATKAHNYANILMPIMGNIGNILYVLIAFSGGLFLLYSVPNPSLSALISGEPILTLSVVVTFLGMVRQFCQNVSQVSQQVNSVVMALAGAKRIFTLLDEEEETDNGYVELVNAKVENGALTESETRTGQWAWRHPHGTGEITYTPLEGDIVFDTVDFSYTGEKMVLHDISLYARPGQKIALVGATGAGKTTITNLLNRFYDIADGKVRYDAININKIKKPDLRRSLGIVLQDVNLFTGTVMENIRYGKLEATDEECINAAVLANADSFIRRLPHGYQTMLTGNGSELSQGQRQLISIARAAVANPPVMILDEATSSIDTRTEALVQKGMDALMKGRTVFVIAHRLSTVRNSDVILVLDHGRIVERGSHESLLAEKGIYHRLYTGAFELE